MGVQVPPDSLDTAVAHYLYARARLDHDLGVTVALEPFVRLKNATTMRALVTYRVVETGLAGTIESMLLRTDGEGDHGQVVWRLAD